MSVTPPHMELQPCTESGGYESIWAYRGSNLEGSDKKLQSRTKIRVFFLFFFLSAGATSGRAVFQTHAPSRPHLSLHIHSSCPPLKKRWAGNLMRCKILSRPSRYLTGQFFYYVTATTPSPVVCLYCAGSQPTPGVTNIEGVTKIWSEEGRFQRCYFV